MVPRQLSTYARPGYFACLQGWRIHPGYRAIGRQDRCEPPSSYITKTPLWITSSRFSIADTSGGCGCLGDLRSESSGSKQTEHPADTETGQTFD